MRQSPGIRRRILAAAVILTLGALAVYRWTIPSAASLIEDARKAMGAKDYQNAILLASESLKLKSDSVDAMLIAAEAAVKLGDFEQGLRYCLMLPEDATGPEVFEALKGAGQQAIFAGRVSDAEQLYQRALKLAPDDLTVHRRLSAIYLSECRRWESIPHLFALVKGRAFTLEELAFLGDVEELYDAESVLDMFEKAVTDDPGPLMGRARILLFKNFSREGEELLRRVIAKRPDLIEAHAQLGVVLVSESRSEEIQEWERQLPPGADLYPEIWWVRGTQARKQGDSKGSIRCAWEALRLDPNHVGAAYQLAQLLASEGKAEQARRFAERAALLESLCLTIHDILLIDKTAERMQRAAELCEKLGRPWEAWAWHVAIETYHPSAVMKHEIQRLRAKLNDSVPQTILESNLAVAIDLSSYPIPRLGHAAQSSPPPTDPSGSRVRFEDLASSIGLDFRYENGAPADGPGFMIYQSIGSGVAVVDLDRDNAPDLFFPQAGPWPVQASRAIDRIYRNRAGLCQDVTESAIPADADLGFGAAVGDWNADGMPDIYVANFDANRLLMNNGDGTFTDVTLSAGITSVEWTVSCAIADINGDGLPDLYDVNYCERQRASEHKCFRPNSDKFRTCVPAEFKASDDMLHLNLGDGRFQEIGQEAGIHTPEGRGMGIVVANLDPEPGMDIFVANDTTANFLFSNRTSAPGALPQFEQIGVLSGVAYDSDGRPQASMGVAVDDANGDGLIDLFVTNFYSESNTLYQQQPGGGYIDQTRTANLRDGSVLMLSWGTQFIDAELDGKPDLVVVSGHVDEFSDEDLPFRMKPQFFRNQGEEFVELSSGSLGPYFEHPQLARGMARLDWDQDGREDVVIVRLFEPAVLLANRTPDPGHCLGVRLVGRNDRDAIGSEVEIRTGAQFLRKQLTAGDGFASSNERRLVFGLGEVSHVDEILVRWHGGKEQLFFDVDADQELLLIEDRESPYQLPEGRQ